MASVLRLLVFSLHLLPVIPVKIQISRVYICLKRLQLPMYLALQRTWLVISPPKFKSSRMSYYPDQSWNTGICCYLQQRKSLLTRTDWCTSEASLPRNSYHQSSRVSCFQKSCCSTDSDVLTALSFCLA